MNNIENGLKNEYKEQKKYLTQVEKYVNKWQEAYESKNFDKMSDTFQKLEDYIKKVMPIEGTIKIYDKIESIQNIIKNNGENFDCMTEETLELIEVFSH